MPTAPSTRLALTAPLAGEGNNVPADIATLIAQLEAIVTGRMSGAGDPPAAAAANAGHIYRDTTSDKYYISTGAVWFRIITEDLKDILEKKIAANTGVAYAIDCNAGSVFLLELTADTTLSITNPPPAGSYQTIVLFIHVGATPRTIAVPAGWKPANDSIPAAPAANKTVQWVITTGDGGTTFAWGSAGFYTGLG